MYLDTDYLRFMRTESFTLKNLRSYRVALETPIKPLEPNAESPKPVYDL